MREKDRHEEVIRKIYDDVAAGDIDAVLTACTDEIVFHVPGSNEISGTYGKSEFAGLMTRVMELSENTFREEVLDVMTGSSHAAVLLHSKLDSNGEQRGYITLHLWQFDTDGKPAEWWEFPRDLVAFDEIWKG